eukprot:NODE_1856_length_2352_cov_11.435955.p1 GENE.NODE_1856_length_2352_cov_11.435955~~NODE_1856_length_2352_cov_11.435955.p1  ORF type:complete len:654 (-),score=145.20 NODE_1856_length_2352_cov_11.435955:341-2302(-)
MYSATFRDSVDRISLPGMVAAAIPGDTHWARPARAAALGAEAAFWIGLIKAADSALLPVAPPEKTRDESITMGHLHMYDVTCHRLRELFSQCDKNHDDRLNATNLAAALDTLGIPVSKDRVMEIMQHIVAEREAAHADIAEGCAETAELFFEDFEVLLTRLRLAELFTANAGKLQFDDESRRFPSHVIIRDYNATTAALRPPHAQSWKLGGSCMMGQEDREFFFMAPRQLPGMYRWVHLDATGGLDRITMIRLAVKYHLEPLAIDDILDARTRTKVDKFDEEYFISADIIRLSTESVWHGDATKKPPRVHIHRSNVAMFLSPPPECMRLITILQELDNSSSWMDHRWGKRKSLARERVIQRIKTERGLKFQEAEQNVDLQESDIRHHLRAEGADYSGIRNIGEALSQEPPHRMREKKADFLVYQILDSIVDGMREITQAYVRRLGYFHQRPPLSWTQAVLDELDEVNLELVDLVRSIRPMKTAVKTLMQRDEKLRGLDPLTSMYLEDVEDGIVELLDDIAQLQEMRKSLVEAAENVRNEQMSTTMFTIGIVTAIFLPAQFLTGLYGMNFINPDDGTPDMPELKFKYGYAYCWGLLGGALFLCISLVLAVRFAGDRVELAVRFANGLMCRLVALPRPMLRTLKRLVLKRQKKPG